jgi:thiamine biosynthesis protein ThiS
MGNMITINGKTVPYRENESLLELLQRLKINRTGIAVEVNRTLIPAASHQTKIIHSDDQIEIVTLVGGG